MIAKWLLFISIYDFPVPVYKMPIKETLLSYKLFRNELIPVFNPNEIFALLVWHFILFRSEMEIATE